MDESRTDIPVLNASKAPDVAYYVMECDMTVTSTETVGEATKERSADFHGYLSKEVLDSVLDVIREVLR